MNLIERIIEPGKPYLNKAGLPIEKKFSNRDIFLIAYPVLVEQLLAMLVGLADTMMISYAGEAAVSGVSLVNQLNTIFIMVFSALAAGGAIVASQYVGKDDRENGLASAGQLTTMLALVSFVLTALVLFFGEGLFSLLFGAVEPDVHTSGMVYLNITVLSFPFLAVYNGIAGFFRSMGDTKTVMRVSIVMNVINVVGNAIGIFALHAGVAGVAWPSFISRVVACVLMVVFALNKERTLYLRARDVFTVKPAMMGRIFKIALPGGVENGLFQLSKVALSSIVAMFGMVQIAANGVAQSFWSVAALFTIAMGPVFITIAGQYMGAGDAEGTRYYCDKLLRMTYLGAAVWNVVFFAATPLVLMLFGLAPETKELVLWLCLIHNVFNALFSPLAFSLSNGLRAAGDVTYNMFAAIFATVVCRVAFSILFGLVFHWGVIGIALAMAVDWLVKGVLMLTRYHGNKWYTHRVI